jgi:hypothetical protein
MRKAIKSITLLFLIVATLPAAAQNGLTLCPDSGCTPIDGEILLTTAAITRTWTESQPVSHVPIGLIGHGNTSVGMTFSFHPNSVKHALVDPYGVYARTWIDGEAGTSYLEVSAESSPRRITWLNGIGGNSVSIVNRLLLTSGTHGAFVVTPEVTSLNGFDLTGMGLHLSRISVLTGQFTSTLLPAGDYYTELPITLQFYGAPGEIPEPSTLALFAIGCAAIRCRRRS